MTFPSYDFRDRRRRAVAARRRTLLLAAVVAVLGAGTALGQYLSAGRVVAGGGGTSRSAGGCFVVEATAGEPAGGRMTGGAYAIEAGYWAGVGRRNRDSLFNNGFQECL